MAKYEVIFSSVFSVFAKPEWVLEEIETIPSNFTKGTRGTEYISVSVLPSGPGINLNSASGILIVDIYTAAGEGPMRAAVIAGRLDAYFVGKSILTGNNRLQFGASSFAPKSIDSADPTLYRSAYSIPFNYFEVQT